MPVSIVSVEWEYAVYNCAGLRWIIVLSQSEIMMEPEPQQKVEEKVRLTFLPITVVVVSQQASNVPSTCRENREPLACSHHTSAPSCPISRAFISVPNLVTLSSTFPARYTVSEAAILAELKHTKVAILQG